MAGRLLNRRELRKQAEVSEAPAADLAGGAVEAPPVKKAKKPAAPRKPRVAKAKIPPRRRARWCIYDGAMKPVALFDYNQRPAADAKLADLLSRAKGPNSHFLCIFKEAIPEEPAAAAK